MIVAFDAISFVVTIVAQCRDWFQYLVAATGTKVIFLVSFFIVAVGRVLLSPIVGTAIGTALGSDMASKKRMNYHGDPSQKRLNGR